MIENKRIHMISLVLAGLLLILSTVTAGALAGEIYADTEGITALSTDTVRVPIVISGADNLVAYQFVVGVGETETATIEVDSKSLADGASVKDGVVMSTGNWKQVVPISGEYKVGELLVTPKSESPVTISISNVRAYEHSLNNLVPYTTRTTTLTVSGTGSDQVIKDEEGGQTIVSGNTDDTGTFETGSKTGVKSVVIPTYSKQPVMVKKNSAGIAQVPSQVKWIYTDEIYTTAIGGQPHYITLTVSEDRLATTGISKDDLFVIHSVLENGKNVWYQLPIAKKVVNDGYVDLTVDAWSSGTYVLAYEAGGLKFPMEEASTTYEPEMPTNTPSSGSDGSNPSAKGTVKPTTSPTGSSPLGFGIVIGLIAAVGFVAMIEKRRI